MMQKKIYIIAASVIFIFVFTGADLVNLVLQPKQIILNAGTITDYYYQYMQESSASHNSSLALLYILEAMIPAAILLMGAVEILVTNILFFCAALGAILLITLNRENRCKFIYLVDKTFDLAIRAVCISLVNAIALPIIQSFTDQYMLAHANELLLWLQTTTISFIFCYAVWEFPNLILEVINSKPSFRSVSTK